MEIQKRKMNLGKVEDYILGFMLIIVLMNVVADFFPELTAAGNSLNDSGLPLGSFFTPDGVVWYILGTAIFILIWRSLGVGRRKK